MHFFHQWSKWHVYEDNGASVEKRTGTRVVYADTRQMRRCATCGKTQDELVKAGPLNEEALAAVTEPSAPLTT